jgi:hypothetical protein
MWLLMFEFFLALQFSSLIGKIVREETYIDKITYSNSQSNAQGWVLKSFLLIASIISAPIKFIFLYF